MRKILLATVALSMLATPAAFADSRHDDHRGHSSYDHRHDKHVKKPPQHRRWAKGQRVPSQYRNKRIDYRRYHLKAPPSGYHWVENDGQYLMIGVATGLIAAIAAAH